MVVIVRLVIDACHHIRIESKDVAVRRIRTATVVSSIAAISTVAVSVAVSAFPTAGFLSRLELGI